MICGHLLRRRKVKVPFEKGVEMICESLAPMGKEYVETVRQGCLQDRWVDLYPNQGKMEGAFSYGVPRELIRLSI